MGTAGLPGTVVRLPAVYGPGDYQHRLFEYLKRMDDGRPAILLGEGMASWRWTHGYVEDIVLAVVLAVTDERAAGGVYKVGEPDPPSWAGWVSEIGDAGWDGEVVAVPDDRLPEHLDWGLATRQHWVADTSRIRWELGFQEEISREEALRRTVRWERRTRRRTWTPPPWTTPSRMHASRRYEPLSRRAAAVWLVRSGDMKRALRYSLAATVLSAAFGLLLQRRRPMMHPPRLTFLFENPLVNRFVGPERLIRRLDLAPGMRVLDAGCGPGRLTVPLARAVRSDGEVVTLDGQREMLEKLERRLEAEGIRNVRPVRAVLGERPLGEKFDRILLAMVLGEGAIAGWPCASSTRRSSQAACSP
jgi:hypothetical protein